MNIQKKKIFIIFIVAVLSISIFSSFSHAAPVLDEGQAKACQRFGEGSFRGCTYNYEGTSNFPPKIGLPGETYGGDIGSPVKLGPDIVVSKDEDAEGYIVYANFIDFHWGDGNVGVSERDDNVVIQWRGSFLMRGGLYEFSWDVDDGIWINVNGSEFGEWEENASDGKTNITLKDDGIYNIEVYYYEHKGNAHVELSWKKSGGVNSRGVAIPVGDTATSPSGESDGSSSRGSTGGGTQRSFSPGTIIQIKNPLKTDSLADLIDTLINFIFTISIAVAPVVFLYGGFLFVTAAGRPEQITKARSILIWTAIGFVVILLSRGLITILKNLLEI